MEEIYVNFIEILHERGLFYTPYRKENHVKRIIL